MKTNLFLERTFETPLTAEGVRALANGSAWCYQMYNVDWCGSFLAADGRKMLCWFAAPDTESARQALRKSGADTQLFWAGTVHGGPEPVTPNVLVERSFAEPVVYAQIQARARAGQWGLQAHRIELAHSFFAFDRRRMLCLYQAPDAESVRVAQREAAMPIDAVWAFERIRADAPGQGSA
jgi:Nickel responsive protein SCO4226-like